MLVRRATEMQNIIQFSQPAPVAADSAEAALDLVFDQLVLDETPKSFPFEKKDRTQLRARAGAQWTRPVAEAIAC